MADTAIRTRVMQQKLATCEVRYADVHMKQHTFVLLIVIIAGNARTNNLRKM